MGELARRGMGEALYVIRANKSAQVGDDICTMGGRLPGKWENPCGGRANPSAQTGESL